jgi:hypothetical protein
MFFLFKIKYITIIYNVLDDEVISEETLNNEFVIINATDRVEAKHQILDLYKDDSIQVESISEPTLIINPSLKICNLDSLQETVASAILSEEEEEEEDV